MTRIFFILGFLALAGCGGGSGTSPSTPTPTPPPVSAPQDPDLTQNKLLSDAELSTPPLSPAPQASQIYVDWLKDNHHPIRSVTYDQDFSDLAFLSDLIGERRIVQLGESSHGTAEFNHVKTRLVKYLHQEMGFSLLAFESGFFEGTYADSIRETASADSLMRFPFGVWHTEEVLEVFQYVKDTQSTANPLRLAGFDPQISSGYYARLPDFVRSVDETGEFNAAFKEGLANDFARFRNLQIEYSNGQCFQSANANNGACSQISDSLSSLQIRLNFAEDTLSAIENPSQKIKILTIASFATSAQIDKGKAERGGGDASSVRDLNMAAIFNDVRRDLFPDPKTIIWAHNDHIAHKQSETRPASFGINTPMGFHLKRDYPDQLFTIGLFMLRGETADNSGMSVPVVAPSNNSLEAIAYGVRKAALYVDTRSAQTRLDGNAFLFEYTNANIWGGSYGTYQMIPSDQFDGVIFIDKSRLPVYR